MESKGAYLLELGQALDKADCSEDVEGAFQRFIDNVGFSSFAILRLAQERTQAADTCLISTHPEAWAELYRARADATHDPIAREALTSRSVFLWSDIAARSTLTRQEKDVLKRKAAFGMQDGLAVPIHGDGNTVGLVDIAGPPDKLCTRNRSAVALAAIVTYQKLISLPTTAAATAETPLSPREIEVLQWIKLGKSDWQIGQILAISDKTVNYHIENVKRKFGVATRVQAVVSAIQQGSLQG